MTDTEAVFVKMIRDNPLDRETRLVYADWLDEHGDEDGAKRAEILRGGRIPIVGYDEQAIFQLGQCHFAPGIWDKRFVKSLHGAAVANAPRSITPRQFLFTWILCHKYRRQIKGRAPVIVEISEERYERYLELHREVLAMPEDGPTKKESRRTKNRDAVRGKKPERKSLYKNEIGEMPLFD